MTEHHGTQEQSLQLQRCESIKSDMILVSYCGILATLKFSVILEISLFSRFVLDTRMILKDVIPLCCL
jgi:hypothetical protein